MKVFSGSANTPLAEKIAAKLHLALSPLEIHVFPDGEKRVRILEDVVGEDVIAVQPTNPPVDTNYMELFFIVDALKRSGARSVTVVMPYLGYQRQDHVFRSGEAVSLEVVLKTLEAVGARKLIVFDLHSIKTEQVSKTPLIHLSALPLFAEKIRELVHPGGVHPATPGVLRSDSPGVNDVEAILVSPDMGGVRRVKVVSEILSHMPFVAVEKQRDLATGSVTAERMHGGEVGRCAFIVDDMISSGKTIETASNLLREKGAEEIYVFATHPVFSDDAQNILQKAAVEKIFVTDTIEVPKEKQFEKLEILSVADTIAKAIKE